MATQAKHLILVASGKGGVGKSTVAVHLALALAAKGLAVGLLDADIYGPSLPTLLGPAKKPVSPDGKRIVPIEKHGLKLMSMGYLVEPNTAMIWRGPMLAGAVSQLVSDVDWGTLDYLIFDLPPGTGDIQLTLAQKFQVTGAVLVTTPQAVAIADVVRAKAMFDKVRIKVLGVVENMSHFVCTNCLAEHAIFARGGGAQAAASLGLELLSSVPLEPAVREAGDLGQPLDTRAPDGPSAKAFQKLAERLHAVVQEQWAHAQKEAGGRKGLPIVRS